MDKYKIALLAVSFLLLASLAFAQESPVPTHGDVKQFRQQTKEKIKEIKRDTKAETKEIKKDLKQNIKEEKKRTKDEINSVRETLIDDMKSKREESKKRIEDQRKKAKEAIKEKREELKDKLKIVKDERKKQVTEKIDENINALNKRYLDHASEKLDKLEDVLERIAKRADEASGRGVDVSLVQQDITDATKLIQDARNLIVSQSGKVYEIQVVSENGLKQSVQEARKNLHDDLSTVKAAVKKAGEAVRKSAVDLGKAVQSSPSPSPSPTVSATPAN